MDTDGVDPAIFSLTAHLDVGGVSYPTEANTSPAVTVETIHQSVIHNLSPCLMGTWKTLRQIQMERGG